MTVKNAVYALPANAETREDFAWHAVDASSRLVPLARVVDLDDFDALAKNERMTRFLAGSAGVWFSLFPVTAVQKLSVPFNTSGIMTIARRVENCPERGSHKI